MATPAASPSPAPAAAAPAPPSFPFLSMGPGCIVCSEVLLTGPHAIKLGPGCIVHPRARLDASLGPIMLGANNILEEWAAIRATSGAGITIGDCNVMRVGSCVEANVGSANVLECRAHITAAGGVGDGCVIGPTLQVEWAVPSHSVLFGSGRVLAGTQRHKPEQQAINMEEVKAKEVLRDMLTRTHRLLH